MNYRDAIEPVSVLKTKSAQLITKARETRQPIVITQNGKAAAVLQDVESFEKQRKALFMLKLIAQGDKELKRGKTFSHLQAEKHFHEKIKDLRRA